MPSFDKELQNLINSHSKENESNTPDFILARFIADCLAGFNEAVKRRDQWYGKYPAPGGTATPRIGVDKDGQ